MKKLFRNLMLVAVAALGVASCADVPPPFVEPGDSSTGGEESTLPDGVYIDESFATSFGSFTENTVAGTPWIIDYSCAKATGYDNSSQTTTPSKSYLVSKTIDLSASTEAYITFQYILRYATDNGAAKPGVENKVLITNAYTGDPTTTTWTDITGTLTEGKDWNTWSTYNATVPADMIGKSAVVVALYYACESNSATWEVKELKMAEGKPEETPDTPDTPIVPEEGNLLVNGNFEAWTNGQPVNWQSASTASSATLEQSTDAHGGSYAVVVKGASTNKRLAYKEMTLAAGDYTMSFYAKAVSGEASVRPGYAVVVGGSLSGDSYQYAEGYVNGITNAEWMQVTHSFTLEASTTLCLVVMNPKSTGTDVLIDDFKLTTTNGGTEDGGEEETPGGEVTCAQAVELCTALADGATSEETYTIAGYITEVVSEVSRNQQTFWMADTKDGGRVFQAFYANLPDGVTEFKAGSQVKITGKLLKYVNSRTSVVTPEIKNATVEIISEGDGNEGGETPDIPATEADHSFDVASVVSGQSGSVALGTNAYGSQDVNDPSTWYTFKVGDCSWTAARICKAKDEVLGIQMQGNASDVAKQGFLFNTTAFSGIKTIVVTASTTSSYDPTFNLYVGNSEHPVGNVVTGSSTSETVGSARVFTFVFDLSSGDYTHFTIANDLVGALYLNKVEVYTK